MSDNLLPNLAHLPLEVFALILDDLSAFAHAEMGYAYDVAECSAWERRSEIAISIRERVERKSADQYGQLYRACFHLWKWWHNEVTCRGPPSKVRDFSLCSFFL